MPVSVVMPIRLRADSAALRLDPEAAVEAIDTALERQLEACRRAVFEPRGGYARPVVMRPDFTWYGDGAGRIDGDLRARLEARIAAVVARAAERLDAGRTARAAAPMMLRRGESTAYDEARDLPGGYVVDSYQPTAGKPPKRDVVGKKGGRKKGAAASKDGDIPGLCVFWDRNLATIFEDYQDYLHTVLARRFGGAFDGVVLVVFRNAQTELPWYVQASVRVEKGGIAATRIIANGVFALRQVAVDAATNTLDSRAVAMVDTGLVDCVPLASGPIPSREALIALTAALVEAQDSFRDQIDDLVTLIETRKLKISDPARQKAALQDARRFAVQHYAEAFVGGWKTFPVRAYGIRGTGYLFLVAPDVDQPVMPLVFLSEARVKTLAREDAGSGSTESRTYGPPTVTLPGGEAAVEATETECVCEDGGMPWDEGRTVTVAVAGRIVTIPLEPFECEPDVTLLGPLGHRLRRLMLRIAFALRMPDTDWRFAGSFLIGAVRMLDARSEETRGWDAGQPAAIKPTAPGQGDLGDVDAVAGPSPALAAVQALIPAALLIGELSQWVSAGYMENKRLADGSTTCTLGAAWVLHLDRILQDRIDFALRAIFADTSTACLRQMLTASAAAIDALRGERFEAYFKYAYPLLSGLVKSAAELEELSHRMKEAEAAKLDPQSLLRGKPVATSWGEIKRGAESSVRTAFQSWRDARLHLDARLMDWAADMKARRDVKGDVVYLPSGEVLVRDGNGDLWSRVDLDNAIKLKRGTAEMLDPLVVHIREMRGALAAFSQGEEAARRFLHQLLDDMAEANRKTQERVAEDRFFAFETAAVNEKGTADVRGTRYALQGIHKIANEAIGPAFGGSDLHRRMVKTALDVKAGGEAFMMVFELGVVIVLSTLFAPLGILVGAAFVAQRRETAVAHEDLFKALYVPDDVITGAEAELEMFMSHLEIALTLIPESGNIIRGALKTAKAVGGKGVAAGGRAIARQASEAAMREIAEGLERNLVEAFLTQIALDRILSPLVEAIFEPVIAALEAELTPGADAAAADARAQADLDRAFAEEQTIVLEPSRRLEDLP